MTTVGTGHFQDLFPRLLASEGPGSKAAEAFGAADMRRAFEGILAGHWTPVQVGAFATALRLRGETSEVLMAGAQALRGAMTVVDHGLPRVLDTCGTGGDGAATLNLSTAAAVILAAAGVPVAKHGNRSISSRCGSADVVEAMGIPLELDTAAHRELLRSVGITFLFAPAHHPALRHAAQARRELGVRTVFNALGPLANPARATHQLVGVYEDALRPLVGQALVGLGIQRAWVVRSVDGLDEVSPCAETRVTVVEGPHLTERVMTPDDFGLPRVDRAALAGDDAPTNAAALEALLAGRAHPALDAVLLNAAAALVVATGEAPRRSAERARALVVSGAATATLKRWRDAARDLQSKALRGGEASS